MTVCTVLSGDGGTLLHDRLLLLAEPLLCSNPLGNKAREMPEYTDHSSGRAL